MPEDGKNIIKFKNFYKQQKSPFVIYADFESLTKKIEGAEMYPNKSNTINTQLHEACSYCYIVVRSDGKTNKPVEYRGPNAAEHMLKSLMFFHYSRPLQLLEVVLPIQQIFFL